MRGIQIKEYVEVPCISYPLPSTKRHVFGPKGVALTLYIGTRRSPRDRPSRSSPKAKPIPYSGSRQRHKLLRSSANSGQISTSATSAMGFGSRVRWRDLRSTEIITRRAEARFQDRGSSVWRRTRRICDQSMRDTRAVEADAKRVGFL